MARRPLLALEYEGPFFENDPRKTLRQNIRALMDRVAEIGEKEVRRRVAMAPRSTAGPSYSARFVTGRTRSLAGRRWATTAVVSAYGGINDAGLPKREAIRVQASLAGRHVATTSGGRNIGTTRGHEGTARVFARTATGLRRAMREVDLTKGLD